MSYLKKNVVTSNEKIMIEPKKNPIFLILKWIWGVLGCWLLLIPTFKAIKATIEFCTTEYLVTNKCVMEKYGWISISSDQMKLEKIENITVNYTFWGRIFNYGEVCIQGTNRNNIYFSNIKNAEKVQKQINELLANY